MQLCKATDAECETIRLEIYRSGAKKTVRLFGMLPSLVEGPLAGTWLGASGG
jgi:hypothetical protein